MKKILEIDKAFYEIDERTKTYRFYGRNPDWKRLNKKENIKNKKHINGYARIFRDKRIKAFKYQA